jgi:anaerobic nitric oxide reductase transcription regulator
VRELEHLIGRSALRTLARHGEHPRILTLTAADLGLNDAPPLTLLAVSSTVNGDGNLASASAAESVAALPVGAGLREAVSAYERRLIGDSLARHGNNLASAARELGVDRANLSRLTKRLGLK